MPIKLFDATTSLLQKAMDLRQTNQEIIASNIANAETPGYAPAVLDFEKSLQSAVKGSAARMITTDAGHLPGGSGGRTHISRDRSKAHIGDGNGVNLDQEMVNLAQNQLLFEVATQSINKKFALLKLLANDRT